MSNKNTTSGTHYKGLQIMDSHGPLCTDYLEKIHSVTCNSLESHPRTSAFRFDLRLPANYPPAKEDRLIDRFISSLKSQIEHSRNRASTSKKYVHKTDVRYVWAREYSQEGRAHFHFALFLNYDAINTLGCFEEGRDNLYNRIVKAWCVALKMDSFSSTCGLVHIPDNATYKISSHDINSQESFFHRASYLAKKASKIEGIKHSFGGSRK